MHIEEFVSIVEKNKTLGMEEYYAQYPRIEEAYQAFFDKTEKMQEKERAEAVKTLEESLQGMQFWQEIHLVSLLLRIAEDTVYINRMLARISRSTELTTENKFFLYYQMVRIRFLRPDIFDELSDEMMVRIYRQVYSDYERQMRDRFRFLPVNERNGNVVIVFISQFISQSHGPTKTVLDRCSVIKNVLHKTPVIINTMEFLPPRGRVPFYASKQGFYNEALFEADSVEYNEDKFAYVQCDYNMPNVQDAISILEIVKRLKPYYIINIGGNSIVSDICSNIVPTVTINTVPSARTMTEGQFQVMGRAITQEDREWMAKWNKSANHILQCRFTSAFKKQTHQYTRGELGLPENGFIGLVVGGRLGAECSQEFIDMLLEVMRQGVYVAFAGDMPTYDEIARANELFARQSINLEFQQDMLAVDEICDLYINPKRTGGGTSVAEALYKGLPAVTLNYGDVGLGAGADFWVEDYEQMVQQILRYKEDKAFYEEMSLKAEKRAAVLMDSTGEFVRLLEKVESLPEFYSHD